MFGELLDKLISMPLIAQFLSAMVGFNLMILGLIHVLEVFKDKTKTETDNKVHAFLSKIQKGLGALIAYKK